MADPECDPQNVLNAVHDSGTAMGNEELQCFRGDAVDDEQDDKRPPRAFRPSGCIDEQCQDGEEAQVDSELPPGKDGNYLKTNQGGRIGNEKQHGQHYISQLPEVLAVSTVLHRLNALRTRAFRTPTYRIGDPLPFLQLLETDALDLR